MHIGSKLFGPLLLCHMCFFDILEQIPPLYLLSLVACEVILKKDFIKIYEKASQKFRKVSLISNGLALNEELINQSKILSALASRMSLLISQITASYGGKPMVTPPVFIREEE